MTDSDWWHPARHADRRPLLLARNRIQKGLRAWLDDEGFTEVDPAALVASPGNEAHLHAFETRLLDTEGRGETRYLHTSPEFAMKKLIAAGERRIAAFAHVWRNREGGPRHAAEFTMLEWYRCGADYAVLMGDVAAMARIAARAAGVAVLRHGDATCDPFAPFERLSVADAFARLAGIDLAATLAPDGAPDAAALRAQMRATGLRPGDGDTWSAMFSHVLVARIEAHLGHGRLTVLDRYPAAEAALARRCPDDARFSERFEVYACGVELANGFGELTDPVEQRARFEAEMDEKARVYGTRYPLDEALLAALPLMPPTAGIALGFDRLVMLATGAPRVDLVQWAPAG
ncbi:MAG: EF-P lysine aminoacylase GenX [Rubellimicrobium sp.]|nr:EF-P lysine aminoacylase GenX [Rubellimicrobium sp.]